MNASGRAKAAQNLAAGDPSSLGARFDGAGVQFAVYSDAAEALELCLFDQ